MNFSLHLGVDLMGSERDREQERGREEERHPQS